MNPVQGTNVAPALAQISAKAVEQGNQLASAQTSLLMDTLQLAGDLVTDLLGSLELPDALGQNVDYYA